jgi:hypothetical protein
MPLSAIISTSAPDPARACAIARSRVASSASRPISGRRVAVLAAGAARNAPPTSKPSIGRLLPLTMNGSTAVVANRPSVRLITGSVVRTVPQRAFAHRRAARLTASPITA